MHPNGADPAYEWAFGDVNPPVHAWASWRVFKIDAARSGKPDYDFLEQVFHRLLMNFTWWVNRKDTEGNNIFEGGFLGLDNIGIFDRSSKLPGGGTLEQADATSWMAMFSLTMMRMAIELSTQRPLYQDLATKIINLETGNGRRSLTKFFQETNHAWSPNVSRTIRQFNTYRPQETHNHYSQQAGW